MIGQSIGQYEILEKLGEGGMGVVYKARDAKLERTVALKFLPERVAATATERQRFLQEARAAAAVTHPNICTVHDIAEHDGRIFIVMEFVEGKPLRELINAGPMKIERALETGTQLAEGLAAAHERGVVHRDVKPENVIVRKDGTPLLMDFGLAKLEGASRLTREGSTVGTAGYMSPEQVQGQETDHRSDIFSLGTMLHEMFTGQLPFKGVHETAMLYEIVNVDPAPMSAVRPEIDPELDRIVLECLQKEPEDRYQSAKELAKDLRRAKRESGRKRLSGVSAVRPVAQPAGAGATRVSTGSIPAVSGRGASRLPLLTWALGGIALLSTAGLGYFLMNRQQPAPQPVHAHILPPDANVFAVAEGIALSPDGSRLAFVARDSADVHRLWVRPLNSPAAIPILAGEQASYPFWSPDGRTLGFFTESHLKRMDASGGSATTICPATGAEGGTWNADGTILFAQQTPPYLYRVSAQGGTPEPVVLGDTLLPGEQRIFPSFLPDGKSYLFTVRANIPQRVTGDYTRGVMAATLGSPQTRNVAPSRSNGVFAAGHVFYIRENAIVALPFDPDGLAALGTPVIAGERPVFSERWAFGPFTVARGGMLVYQTTGGANIADLVVLDRAGTVLNVLRSGYEFDDPQFSPDGKQLMFTQYDAVNGTGDIWVTDLGRGVSSRFTSTPQEEDDPVWSPDGESIVFAESGNLILRPVNGSGELRMLLESTSDKCPTSWSREESTLLYADFGEATGRDLWIMPMGGNGKPSPFAAGPAEEMAGAFRPGGKFVAYCSDENGTSEVFIRGTGARGRKQQVSTHGGHQPRWAKGGRELFFLDRERMVTVVEVSEAAGDLVLGTPRPLYPVQVTSLVTPRARYDVSADGERIVAAQSRNLRRNASPLTLVTNALDSK